VGHQDLESGTFIRPIGYIFASPAVPVLSQSPEAGHKRLPCGDPHSILRLPHYYRAHHLLSYDLHDRTSHRQVLDSIATHLDFMVPLSLVVPMVWGPLADRYGRKLSFVAYMIILWFANMRLALIPTSAYWLLLVLRFLQSAGFPSTVALGKLLFCPCPSTPLVECA